MKAHAILIAGTDYRHAKAIAQMRRYLITHGHHVTSVRQGSNQFGLNSVIHGFIKSAKEADLVLLIFHGHGHQFGWENGVEYESLVPQLAQLTGKLIFVNDTCYGAGILPALQKVRSPEDTCFLAPWDSEDESYGGCVRDCLQAWRVNRRVEDIITGNILCTDDGDIEVPVQIRWGEQLDHLLYPDTVILEKR